MMTTGDTAELLRLYFIQQRTVNLPGIGGFELNRVPAQVDKASGQIQAPYYTINYDSLNDIPSKEMFDYISRKRNISEWEAIGVVNNFSMSLAEQLKKGQRFEWQGIGSLEHGINGQLEFRAEPSRFDFYESISSSREGASEADETTSYTAYEVGEVETIEAKTSWWVAAAIIAAVALLMIFFSLVRNEYRLTGARETKFVPAIPPSQYELK